MPRKKKVFYYEDAAHDDFAGTPQTVDALMKLDLASGVDVKIKL